MIPADNDTADLLEEAARWVSSSSTSQKCTDLVNKLKRRASVLRHDHATSAQEAAALSSQGRAGL